MLTVLTVAATVDEEKIYSGSKSCDIDTSVHVYCL